jgi:hypothetical protein
MPPCEAFTRLSAHGVGVVQPSVGGSFSFAPTRKGLHGKEATRSRSAGQAADTAFRDEERACRTRRAHVPYYLDEDAQGRVPTPT